MGLDLVELMMRFEEEFDTRIPDHVAGRMVSPGVVADQLFQNPEVVRKYKTRDEVLKKIWEIVEDEIRIDVSGFDEKSRFVEDMRIDLCWAK